MVTDDNAVLIGGPRDGATVNAGDAVVVEFEIDELLYRYTLSRRRLTTGGHAYLVFDYDGETALNP
ncbi:hypothetical protein [Dactylosporangium sp. NPDC051541]|uniref:hypothetical protein n=1 Tax=Dactylosporangium sp. NPDC051541 TaxID=3363977 RepID=UPI0037B63F90